MHQLFLGIVKSNFELVSLWLKEEELGDATFRKNCQPLLGYIRTYGLSWALTHPFSESSDDKSGTLGTSSWVSKNWIAFCRFAKFFYLFCGTIKRKKENSPSPCEVGFDNVMRLVITQSAMISRIMTHSGKLSLCLSGNRMRQLTSYYVLI